MSNIIIIVLQIVGSLLATYLVYYAQNKGRYLADKQDIKKITSIIEEVKRKNNEELEMVKTSLSLISNRHLQIFSEEKDAIIRFFTQLNKWVWNSLNIQLSEFNLSNYTDLSERIIKMKDAYNEVNVAFSKVQLLISDDELIIIGHEATVEALKLHQFIESLAFKLRNNLTNEKIDFELLTSGKIDFQKLTQEVKQFNLSSALSRQKEREQIIKDYNEQRGDFFSSTLQKIHLFKNLAKNYLKQ
jgi:hypothetical protein